MLSCGCLVRELHLRQLLMGLRLLLWLRSAEV
jgi:hypothetical protein